MLDVWPSSFPSVIGLDVSALLKGKEMGVEDLSRVIVSDCLSLIGGHNYTPGFDT